MIWVHSEDGVRPASLQPRVSVGGGGGMQQAHTLDQTLCEAIVLPFTSVSYLATWVTLFLETQVKGERTTH